MYSCLNPVKVFNKYSGEEIYVNCRNCDYCRNKRSYELANRIEREMLNPDNGTCLLVTLDYDNNHLPIYRLLEDGSWYSNRVDARYQPIDNSDVPEFYRPVNHVESYCFGHLAYTDLYKWFCDTRAKFHYMFNRGFNNELKRIFNNWTYEDAKYRYFGCGEYGPTTFRPHYHVLLWFKRKFDAEQFRVFLQVLSSCWQNGSVDVQAVSTIGVKSYVSGYVTSSANLPSVLSRKSIRPFAVFSRSPVIGYVKKDKEEVWEMLHSGITKDTKFDAKTSSYIDVKASASFLCRYFPKCQGFSYEDDSCKLSRYRYVYDYFHGKEKIFGLDVNFVESLRLKDIKFPLRLLTYEERDYYSQNPSPRLVGSDFITWSYIDRYASLVFFKYCYFYRLTPEDCLGYFNKIYSTIHLENLRTFYDYQQSNASVGLLPYTIFHDSGYYSSVISRDFSDNDLQVLSSYGFDLEMLSTDGKDYLLSFSHEDDPNYLRHSQKVATFVKDGVKQKKYNDYKRSVKSNFVRNG